MNIKDFKRDGFIKISYSPEIRRKIKGVTGLWKDFCDLPLDKKKALPYSNDEAGVGYEYKTGKGNKADRKENFDVSIAGEAWLETNMGKIRSTIAKDFVYEAISLVGTIKPMILDFADKAETAFGLKGFYKEISRGESAYFIRFIHYFCSKKIGEEIASAHVDQSGFTPHLFESTPGLQCLSYDGVWTDMPVSNEETVIIPSMQMQLRSKGKIKALCHRVIATGESLVEGRYSAVCFVQFKDTPKYDKNEHGRLQEFPPGFNYDMPFEDFSKLFKAL